MASRSAAKDITADVKARDLERIAVDTARDAAAYLRERAAAVRVVATKSSPTDIVTNLDTAVEGRIRSSLTRQTPEASLLGEEDGWTSGDSPVGWIVDPIDGTVNLAYDLPVLGVSIAATIAGRVVAGSVIDVARDETFSAAIGTGARLNGSQISASPVADLSQALVATGFDYTPEGRTAEAKVFARVLPAARDIRCYGSTALQLCWAACGRVDAFYQRHSKQWDYAAGALIAAEAGATVIHPDSTNDSLLLAAPGPILEPLLALMA